MLWDISTSFLINWQVAQGVSSYTECKAYFPMAFSTVYQIVAHINDNWNAAAHASVQNKALSYFSFATRAGNAELYYAHHISAISVGY